MRTTRQEIRRKVVESAHRLWRVVGSSAQTDRMSIGVLDVAAYILEKTGPITAMKLQKLCYYAQAWNLVWEDRELFPEEIQAWANGPISPTLYRAHRGEFVVTQIPSGKARKVKNDPAAASTIEGILATYQQMSTSELSTLTHREAPWSAARRCLLPGQASQAVITHAAMVEYYSSLI